MKNKKCTKCAEIKDVSEFNKHANTKDKLTTYCKLCLYVQSKEWVVKNKEKVNTWYSEYREANRPQLRENSKRWRDANKGKKNADTAKRFAAKMKRIPKWLTEEDKQYIRCLYQLSAMRSRDSEIKWNVDHVVPLQGENVSGLHVPWNLQVIPAADNFKKNNKWQV